MARNLVGLDIGSRFIKAVQLTEEKDTYSITQYARVEIQPQEPIPDALRGIFESNNFQTKRVVTSVSGRFVIVRYITMPVMSEDELRNAAKYELGKYIPFEVDEVIHDCQKLEEVQEPTTPEGEKEMRVLLVAAKRTFIDEHTSLLEDAGLQPHVIDVDSFALGNCYELGSTLNPEQQDRNKLIAIIDVGATKTNINIANATTSYFTREFYKGGDDITDVLCKKMALEVKEAEVLKRNPGSEISRVSECIAGTIDDICHDINISIDFFENQYDRRVDSILLTGGCSQTVGLSEDIERTIGRPIVKWNPLENFEINLDDEKKAQLTDDMPQVAIALGLASRIRKD